MTRELVAFLGFPEDDPLRVSLQNKLKLHQVARQKILDLRKGASLNGFKNGKSSEVKAKKRAHSSDQNDLSSSESDSEAVKKQMKRLLPNDERNFIKVKGARVKQVSHASGHVKKLPKATFGINHQSDTIKLLTVTNSSTLRKKSKTATPKDNKVNSH